MNLKHTWWMFILLAALTACEQPAAQQPDPQALLQAIPSADSAKYESVRDMKNFEGLGPILGWTEP